VPNEVDPGDFIGCAGTLKASEERQECLPVPTVHAVIADYLEHLGHLAETNRYTIRIHLNNLQKYNSLPYSYHDATRLVAEGRPSSTTV
jgi:hypothetical protein